MGSVSSANSYVLPERGPGVRKTAVRLVNRGIQAGDLEIVSHATRRHTRDVGTTFPSPSESSNPKASLRERSGRRSQSKRYPQGVSWFIAADDQRWEDRKENRPEEWAAAPPRRKGEGPDTGGRGSAWFEAYSGRVAPWREPLRQRQVVQEEEEERSSRVPVVRSDSLLHPGPPAKTTSSGLVRLSLQEALALRRPDFVSGSRERTRRLALQAEERRRLRPLLLLSEDGASWRRAPNLTGTSRRAVPRKEMVLRSKLIYQKLPEVRCLVEEERRRAEYHSYRLNAEQYNKRVTGRVLGRVLGRVQGRRSAWQ